MRLAALLFLATLVACTDSPSEQEANSPLFSTIPADSSNVTFTNTLSFDESFNIYTYRNYYNGGGVALGDINNDGLLDIYFTGNLVDNALYLNEGNLRFREISEEEGVKGNRAWSTVVSMADINGDGWLDIYVCNSGDVAGDNKQNELFINNGDGTFTEMAAEYGLADRGFSTHAAFFDYDKDGDLDVYLLNNSYQAIGSFNLMQNKRPERDSVGGDKLYRNEGGVFRDVSEEAGIYGSVIGFGLGVTVGDVNNDTWPDIFISNDFFERDYLYINNQDGTFRESLEDRLPSVSAASMGADMADINNDGWMDIFVTDMLPESLERLKQVTTFENWDKLNYNASNGYHYQFTRNMLHLNNQDGSFSEIGRLAGVEATDWSWGALIFDMDNDGFKDIFVANGIYQDITDRDYLNFIYDDETKKRIISEKGVDYKGLIDPIPVNPISNYAFLNNGDLTFSNRAEALGLGVPVHSNGSAYGDLDNDGDLDLVVNNVNAVSNIFRNNATDAHSENHYLRVKLLGEGMNTDAVGARITLKMPDRMIVQEQQPTRGFESSVDPVVHFGLGEDSLINTLQVTWPDGRVTILKDVVSDQIIALKQSEAAAADDTSASSPPEAGLFSKIEPPLDFVHKENYFVDFDRDRLTYHMRSNEGPAVAQGDVNGDGLMDLYFGGAKDEAGQLYLSTASGTFTRKTTFDADARGEDTDAIFVDVDGDDDLDLFVASGGNEFGYLDPALQNRLYLNDGNGNFSKSPTFLSAAESTAVVAAADFDNDGDTDLFTGSRLVPFNYGLPADSHLLMNDGEGNFTDVTDSFAPSLESIGMITDAVWADVDGDSDADLMIVGEWMAPVVLLNEDGTFLKQTVNDTISGWYNVVKPFDLEGDGDIDFLLGNTGMNNRFKPSVDQSTLLYVGDFDGNGAIEHLFARKINNQVYPLTLKHDLEMQVPSLKKKYLKYASYNDQRVDQIFTAEQLSKADVLEITELRSGVLVNNGFGEFDWRPLPVEAQFSPIYDFLVLEKEQWILGGGNQYRVKPEAGRYDASYGFMLHFQDGSLVSVHGSESRFVSTGEVRKIVQLNDSTILVVRNNDTPDAFRIR